MGSKYINNDVGKGNQRVWCPGRTDLPKGNIKWKKLRLYRDHALSNFVIHSKGSINAWMNNYSRPKCVFCLVVWGLFLTYCIILGIKLPLIVEKLN